MTIPRGHSPDLATLISHLQETDTSKVAPSAASLSPMVTSPQSDAASLGSKYAQLEALCLSLKGQLTQKDEVISSIGGQAMDEPVLTASIAFFLAHPLLPNIAEKLRMMNRWTKKNLLFLLHFVPYQGR